MSQTQPKPQDPSPLTSRLHLVGFIAGAAVVLFSVEGLTGNIRFYPICSCSLWPRRADHHTCQDFLDALAVLIATLVVVAAIGGPFMTYGSRLWAQFDEIAMDIPRAVNSIKTSLEAHPSVQFLEQIVGDIDFSKIAAPVVMHMTSVISVVSTIIAYALLLLFGGVYLALSPDLYVNGPAGSLLQVTKTACYNLSSDPAPHSGCGCLLSCLSF